MEFLDWGSDTATMEEFKATVSKIFDEMLDKGEIKAKDTEITNYKRMIAGVESKYAFVRDGRFFADMHRCVMKKVKL